MRKNIGAFVIAMFLSIFFLSTTAYANDEEIYTDRDSVSGNMFTNSEKLAAVLNSIFDGNADIFYDIECQNLVDTKIGSYNVPDNRVNIHAGEKGHSNSGTSCWIYANGVYHALFGELTGNGYAEQNSIKLDISPASQPTFKNFQSWNVRNTPGALMRSYEGHSMIVLKYDSSFLTVLEGNGDGHGRVQIRKIPWEGVNFTVGYIIQPKNEYYDELYGYLTECKLYTSFGKIEISKKTTVKTYPCSKGTYSGSEDVENPKVSTKYTVTGLYRNSAGNYWYRIDIDGIIGYVFAGDASYSVTTDKVLARGKNYFSIDGKILSYSQGGKNVLVLKHEQPFA